jgi:multiple sugar transport system substrate-binding protein
MTTLKMWIMPLTMQTKQIVAREISTFQEEFAGIEVSVEVIPWSEAWFKIMNLAKEKEGPDIIQLGSTWNGSFASSGVLRDITEFVNTIGGGTSFVPASWSSCLFPDRKKTENTLESPKRVSSVPWFADIRTLFYRADIFKDLDLGPVDLETWDSFLDVCQKTNGYVFNGKKMSAMGFSGQKEAMLVHNIAPWIWGAGGDFISPQGDKAIFNNETALSGIKFFLGLVEKGYIAESALTRSTEEVAQSFCVSGDYVMSFSGAHCMPNLLDPNAPAFIPEISGNCVASLFPAGTAGRFVFCGGSNLAITSFSPHADEAWSLLRYFIGFDSQNRFPKSINMLPSLLESFDATFITDDPKDRALKESWRFGRAFPNVPVWGEIELVLIDYLARIWERIQKKQYDFSLVKKDLDEAAQKADELLAKAEVK